MSTPGIRTFDDFREYSLWYLHDVGLTVPEILNNEFKVVLAPARSSEVEFGDYAGKPKWRGPADLPSGEWNGRTANEILVNLANIQGDTEFGSNELQVGLWDSAPSDYDRKILLSVMNEEFRHGWQMAWFETDVMASDEGRQAAQSLLERRAAQKGNMRLLGAFNNIIHDWPGFYCFLEFMDRDGGSQLSLLQHSAVQQLAESMTFMLREEAKHLRSGEQGFERMIAGGKIPIDALQKYVNLFAPLGYDLHGGERSTNALIYFKLGLKGFYPSARDYLDGPVSDVVDAQLFADLKHREAHKAEFSYKYVDLNLDGPARDINKELLNAITVTFYKRTLEAHFAKFNDLIARHYPAGTPRLVLPSIRFNRAEPSVYAGERYDIHGRPIESEAAWRTYLAENLPSEKDLVRIRETARLPGWIAPPEMDVYKALTAVKPNDKVMFQTTFGMTRKSRFVSNLSKAAAAPSAAASGRPAVAQKKEDTDFWQWMQNEGAG